MDERLWIQRIRFAKTDEAARQVFDGLVMEAHQHPPRRRVCKACNEHLEVDDGGHWVQGRGVVCLHCALKGSVT